jgi:hypothetical protein
MFSNWIVNKFIFFFCFCVLSNIIFSLFQVKLNNLLILKTETQLHEV